MHHGEKRKTYTQDEKNRGLDDEDVLKTKNEEVLKPNHTTTGTKDRRVEEFWLTPETPKINYKESLCSTNEVGSDT